MAEQLQSKNQSPEQDWTIKGILLWTTEFFKSKGIVSPRLDSELLIAKVIGLSRLQLYLQYEQIVTQEQRQAIKGLIKRRAAREPLQYLLGSTEFYHCTLQLTSDVLIPRHETEYMVEIINKGSFNPRNILDIGTGSGAIAIALAKMFPHSKVDAIDVSSKALAVAKNNAIVNQVVIEFTESDLFTEVNNKYDLIVSNPPYISETEYKQLQPELFFEPKTALVADQDGLSLYLAIISQAKQYLQDKGVLYLEIGSSQAASVQKIAVDYNWSSVTIIKDLNNLDRIAILHV